jgi:hypothetical protein
MLPYDEEEVEQALQRAEAFSQMLPIVDASMQQGVRGREYPEVGEVHIRRERVGPDIR